MYIRGIESNFWKLASQTILERLLYGDGLLPQVDPADDPLEEAQPSTVQADPTTHPVLTHGYAMMICSENIQLILIFIIARVIIIIIKINIKHIKTKKAKITLEQDKENTDSTHPAADISSGEIEETLR